MEIELKPITKVKNETAWCGPSIVSSITGEPIGKINEVIKAQRVRHGYGTFLRFNWHSGDEHEVRQAVKGTSTREIKLCLNHYGFDINPSCNNAPKKTKGREPTISQWLKQRTVRECNLVSAGHHWQLVQGVYFCDSFTGKPVIVSVAPHQRARVRAIYKVTKL